MAAQHRRASDAAIKLYARDADLVLTALGADTAGWCVIEIAKAATIAYNNKNWDNLKDVFAPDGVYDEKGTHRRIQGVEKIIDAWKGWGTAIPDSRATFVREFASGNTAVIEVVRRPQGAVADAIRHDPTIEQIDRDPGVSGHSGGRQ